MKCFCKEASFTIGFHPPPSSSLPTPWPTRPCLLPPPTRPVVAFHRGLEVGEGRNRNRVERGGGGKSGSMVGTNEEEKVVKEEK